MLRPGRGPSARSGRPPRHWGPALPRGRPPPAPVGSPWVRRRQSRARLLAPSLSLCQQLSPGCSVSVGKGAAEPPRTMGTTDGGSWVCSSTPSQGIRCHGLRVGNDLGVLVLTSPKGCCVQGGRAECDQQCQGHLATAQFDACGEKLVAGARHLYPGAPQTPALTHPEELHLTVELLAQHSQRGARSA